MQLVGNMNKAFEWVAQAIEKKSSLLLLRYTDPVVAVHKK